MTKAHMHLSVVLALVCGTVLLIALGKLPESHWATVIALFVPSVLGAKDEGGGGAKPPSVPLPVLAVMLYAFGALLAVAINACTPAVTPAAAEAAYTAEQLACTQADSKAESRACRAEVDKRWGVAPRDAGKD